MSLKRFSWYTRHYYGAAQLYDYNGEGWFIDSSLEQHRNIINLQHPIECGDDYS